VGDRAVLAAGEHLEDIISGCFACGTRRSSNFHRSPVIYDMEWAFGVWGYLAEAPADLVEFRRPLFAGVHHDYSRQRAVADAVAPEAVRLTPSVVQSRLKDWRTLLVATPAKR
jgi:hypothetical protein